MTISGSSVAAIHRYPVESMLGEALPACRIEENGLIGDRAYALIDVETGAVVSATVPRRWAGVLGSPRATAPCRSPAPPRRPSRSRSRTGFVEASTSRFDDGSGEAISRLELAPGSFFDLAAVHVLTGSTLDRLRSLAPGATFDARRYRPNLALSGAADGFVENEWLGRVLAIGGHGARLAVSMPTMRCVMTTLAQGDLPVDARTLRTIARHNRVDIPELGTWACAGAYADVAAAGEVAVGDPYELV
jgi:uncharacterized protein YcbX